MDQLTETHANQPSRLYDDTTDGSHPNEDSMKLATKFLLAEYETIRSFKEQSDISTDRRLDILLSVVTVIGAALGFLSQSQQIPTTDFLIVALLATASLIIVSLSTLRQVLSRDVITADYTRSLNRIRHFFAVENPATKFIKPYILMNTDFNSPKYGRHSKSRETVVIIISLLFAALAEITRFLFFPSASLDLLLTVTVMFDAFVWGYLILTISAHVYYWNQQRRTNNRIRNSRPEVMSPPDPGNEPLTTHTHDSISRGEIIVLIISALLTIALTLITLIAVGVL